MKTVMMIVVMLTLSCSRHYEACTGAADCSVCKNCSRCKWCKAHPDQPCGVMKKLKGE